MKPKRTQAPVTEIAFILDRSGSMDMHAPAAIAGFNEFLREQQAVEGIARLTLVLFDDCYEVPVDNLPVSEVVALDSRSYRPRGTTALLDAVGRTIRSFRERIRALPESQRPDQVIFAIFTDGLENASKGHTWADIAQRIRKRQTKDGWQFLFLAANQDAIATAAQMNIHAKDAATASFTEYGIRGSARAFNRKLRAMREGDQVSADYQASMRELQEEEELRRDDPAK